MDINTVRQLLDKIPVRSDYEFRNFEIETQGSWHRQVRYVLREKERLTDEISFTEANIDLINHSVLSIADAAEQAIRRRMADTEINGLKRQISDAAQQLAQIDSWLDTYDDSEFTDVVKGLESNESDNWSEQLGRQVGVELLADTKATRDSMHKLSLLPLSDYKKSVMITNQFATFLKKTAEQVEATLYPNRPDAMPSSDTVDIAAAQEPSKAKKKK